MNEEKNTIGVEKMELIKNRKGKLKNHPCSSKLKMKRREENVM
jgi:hypothetical protein